MQFEGHVAVQPAALAHPVQGVVEDGQSGPQGLAEPGLLAVQHIAYVGVGAL